MTTTQDIETAGRVRYDIHQLEAYFERIGLPRQARILDVSGLGDDEQLAYLTTLQRHQIVRVPFENLSLHYSWHRSINVDAGYLFKKVVHQPGRGGYCMENNTLFHSVLLSLGFRVYLTGARVFNPAAGRFGGFSHCLNIITIGGARYAVDVGFGAYAPVTPLRLVPGEAQPYMASASVRLRHAGLAQSLWPEDRVWIYEHRRSDAAPWVPQHCFTGGEFLPEDIAIMNLGPSKSPASWFLQKVVCVRFTSDAETYTREGEAQQYGRHDVGHEISGKLIIDGNALKWRRGDTLEWEKKFQSDAERVQALETYFGIVFADEDRTAIKGTVGEVVNTKELGW